MKRFFLIILASLPLLASAQTYDTISGPNGRHHRYHYTAWFDTCGIWSDTQTRAGYGHPEIPGSLFIQVYSYPEWWRIDPFGGTPPPIQTIAKTEYIPRVSAIKGIAVLTTDGKKGSQYSEWIYYHPVTENTSENLAPDTCFVFKVVNGQMDVLGYARWDTATPKIYKVPWHEDSVHAGYAYIETYEAYFKTPIMVSDTFYIAGTPYNQELDAINDCWAHPPRQYATIDGVGLPDDPCVTTWDERMDRWFHPTGYRVTWSGPEGIPTVERDNTYGRTVWGAFLPILSFDSVWLRAQSADQEMGTTDPSRRRVLQWVTHTIKAVPRTGYKFSHWHDGNTDNPREVLMDKDSVFTAYFEPKEQYHIAVSVDNPEHGYVTGGGTYYELDTVRMEAFPSSDRYQFDFWGDGNASNPRYLLARGDTSFIAFFREAQVDTTGINAISGNDNLFSLTPNPATGRTLLTISCPGQQHELTVRDAAGHEVLYKVIPPVQTSVDLDLSNLPAGAYFVTLSTPASSATQRLVVK